MAKKKLSPLEKVEELVEKSQNHGWSRVDTENQFDFNGSTFKNNESVVQYKVLSKGVENTSDMDAILCIDDGDEIKFFDQLYKEIGSELVVLM